MRGLNIPSQLPLRMVSTGDSTSDLPRSSLGRRHLEKKMVSIELFFIQGHLKVPVYGIHLDEHPGVDRDAWNISIVLENGSIGHFTAMFKFVKSVTSRTLMLSGLGTQKAGLHLATGSLTSVMTPIYFNSSRVLTSCSSKRRAMAVL